jgi:biopolymer transport protein TolQ
MILASDDLWTMVSRTVGHSGGVEKLVFFLLMGCSIVLWTIFFLKISDLYFLKRNTARFQLHFEGADSLTALKSVDASAGDSVMLAILKSAFRALELSREQKASSAGPDSVAISLKPAKSTDEMVLLAMQHTSKAYYSQLQSGLSFLATIGSTTPFIGLFGTVWGIMTTFNDLGGVRSPSMSVVAPGISSALIATAAGLAVAIPAVVAYNYFLTQIDKLQEQSDCFIERMMALIRASRGNTGGIQDNHHAGDRPESAAPRYAAKPILTASGERAE